MLTVLPRESIESGVALVALRALQSRRARITLRPLRSGRAQIPLVALVPLQPRRARGTLRPLRSDRAQIPLVTLVALQPRRTQIAFRPLRSGRARIPLVALVPLQPRRARITLRPLEPGGAGVTFRTVLTVDSVFTAEREVDGDAVIVRCPLARRDDQAVGTRRAEVRAVDRDVDLVGIPLSGRGHVTLLEGAHADRNDRDSAAVVEVLTVNGQCSRQGIKDRPGGPRAGRAEIVQRRAADRHLDSRARVQRLRPGEGRCERRQHHAEDGRGEGPSQPSHRVTSLRHGNPPRPECEEKTGPGFLPTDAA